MCICFQDFVSSFPQGSYLLHPQHQPAHRRNADLHRRHIDLNFQLNTGPLRMYRRKCAVLKGQHHGLIRTDQQRSFSLLQVRRSGSAFHPKGEVTVTDRTAGAQVHILTGISQQRYYAKGSGESPVLTGSGDHRIHRLKDHLATATGPLVVPNLEGREHALIL